MTLQQQQTARDLRTAAQVSKAAGHTTGTAVDSVTGRLCAVGALHLATGISRLITDNTDQPLRDRFLLRFFPVPDAGRLLAAARALAPQLPEPCPECLRTYRGTDSEVIRLIHFNDHVCRGGEELQLLFIQGAEKIEADL
jgi:hypothetical protein